MSTIYLGRRYDRIRKNCIKYAVLVSRSAAATQRVPEIEYTFKRLDKKNIAYVEDKILFNQYHLGGLYQRLWASCDSKEQYFLYDMSEDGFINYKNTIIIQQLFYKGILVEGENGEPRIMSVSFRNFILDKAGSEEVKKLKNEFRVQGSWSGIKTPVLIGITVVGIFLFMTQESLLQRVVALVPTLSAMLSLTTNLFGSGAKASAAART